MTEKHDYAATIRGKGLDGTGVTEDIAKAMYHSKGSRTLAIVELVHKRQVDDEDTGRKVELAISLLEPSTSAELDDHLRELTRTLHQNRVLKSKDDQLQIDTLDDLEPTVDGVIAAGKQHIAETDDELPEPEEPPIEGATYDHDAKQWIGADGDPVASEPDAAWEYDATEGTREPVTVPNPFDPGTTGDDAA